MTYEEELQKETCWICKRTLKDIKREVPELALNPEDKNERMKDPSVKWCFAVCPICAELIDSVASEWHIDNQYIEEWFMPKIMKYLSKHLKLEFDEK